MKRGGLKALTKEEVLKIQEQYRKSLFQSKYGVTYGHRENDASDPTILNFRKFSEMSCSSVLNDQMLRYIDNWCQLKDDQSYTSLILKALKAIYTRSRLERKPESAYRRLHAWAPAHEKVKGERIDRVVTAHNNKLIFDRAARHVPKPDSRFVKRKRDPVREARIEREAREIESKRKEKLLRGNGKILAYYDPVDGRPSSYQASFKQT